MALFLPSVKDSIFEFFSGKLGCALKFQKAACSFLQKQNRIVPNILHEADFTSVGTFLPAALAAPSSARLSVSEIARLSGA